MGSDKMDKYLQKKPKYKEVETIDKVYAKSLDKSDKEQGKNKKKIEKMLIRDDRGSGIQMKESEDGVMTYFTGQGNYHQAIRYGSKPDLSRRTRQHNLQFAREVLEAEGILTPEMDEAVKNSIKEILDEAKNNDKTQMLCIECGKRFKKKIGPKTFEVKCPKCGSYDTEPV